MAKLESKKIYEQIRKKHTNVSFYNEKEHCISVLEIVGNGGKDHIDNTPIDRPHDDA